MEEPRANARRLIDSVVGLFHQPLGVSQVYSMIEDSAEESLADASGYQRRATSKPVSEQVSLEECLECKLRREKYQAIGMVVFVSTIGSFGLLTPITLPLAVFLAFWSARSCKACRMKHASRKLD